MAFCYSSPNRLSAFPLKMKTRNIAEEKTAPGNLKINFHLGLQDEILIPEKMSLLSEVWAILAEKHDKPGLTETRLANLDTYCDIFLPLNVEKRQAPSPTVGASILSVAQHRLFSEEQAIMGAFSSLPITMHLYY